MLIGNVTGNIPLGAFHARNLQSLRGADPQKAIDEALSIDMGTLVRGNFYPQTGNNLAFYHGGTTQRKIVYIDGVQTQDQALQILTDYSTISPTSMVGTAPVPLFFFSQSSRIVDSLLATHDPAPEYVDVCGYSAGGATALAMAGWLRQRISQPKLQFFTYGAPRTAGTVLKNALGRTPVIRWMTPGDPIPLLPLHLEDLPILSTLLTAVQIELWSLFVHVDGGRQVNGDGTTVERVLPTDASVSAVASLANWWMSQEGDPLNQHSMQTYVNYLTAAAASVPLPSEQNVEVAPGEEADVPHRREVNRARIRIETAINNLGREQNTVPHVTPTVDLFKAIRQGRIWYVALGDEIVITAPIEKRARHIARAGNDFLRSLQKQAVVDPVSLAAQVTLFLKLAQDPANGFSPTINVQNPI